MLYRSVADPDPFHLRFSDADSFNETDPSPALQKKTAKSQIKITYYKKSNFFTLNIYKKKSLLRVFFSFELIFSIFL